MYYHTVTKSIIRISSPTQQDYLGYLKGRFLLEDLNQTPISKNINIAADWELSLLSESIK